MNRIAYNTAPTPEWPRRKAGKVSRVFLVNSVDISSSDIPSLIQTSSDQRQKGAEASWQQFMRFTEIFRKNVTSKLNALWLSGRPAKREGVA
jgi:hypothetical protein